MILIIKKNNDPRSYRQNSDKLLASGFIRKFSVDDAIEEMTEGLAFLFPGKRTK